MTQVTSNERTAQFMTALWAQVAAQDAAQDARLVAIMARKPARPGKVDPALARIASSLVPQEKASAPLPAGKGKAKRKKAAKAKS
jgi:hypothetical protein